jgi:hypothetical protein
VLEAVNYDPLQLAVVDASLAVDDYEKALVAGLPRMARCRRRPSTR